jgi:hypothetical protein
MGIHSARLSWLRKLTNTAFSGGGKALSRSNLENFEHSAFQGATCESPNSEIRHFCFLISHQGSTFEASDFFWSRWPAAFTRVA